MSAKDQISAMLDELMGTSRNGEKSNSSYNFDDRSVCRAFLLGCCPYMILQQTKADMGSCNKIHDLALKADYEKALQKRSDYNFEYDALAAIEKFIAESDRRKEIAKIRLKESQEELGEEAAKKMQKLNEVDEEIAKKLAKAEEYGSEGDADNSLKMMEEVDELKEKKKEMEQLFNSSMPASAFQQQKLRICDICSAHLGIHDNDRRLVDHFSGKLHLGFITIREKLEELKKKVAELREQRKNNRDNEKKRSRSRSRGSSSRYKRSDSKSRRSRSRSRDRYRRSPDSRSRRSPNSSRDKDRRDRDRDYDSRKSSYYHKSGRNGRRRSRSRS